MHIILHTGNFSRRIVLRQIDLSMVERHMFIREFLLRGNFPAAILRTTVSVHPV